MNLQTGGGSAMKRIISFCLLASLVVVASTANADTIHLKNGSVIKGKVASYADDQFVVVLDTGSSRYMSRAMIFIGDVARIEFDSAGGAGAELNPSRETSTPRETSPLVIAPRETERESSSSRPNKPSGGQTRDTAPSDSQPGSSSRETAREPVKEPVREPENAATTAPPAEVPEVAPTTRKSGPVKTINVDVAAKREWTSTGVIVKRGDRIRITATGTVTLDPTAQHTSGPEGTDLTDARKLMTDRPTGALIGVIGADNDDFIFIGRSAEFTATRDGLLFLSANEGTLSDNSGAFKATIEVQSQSARKP
jgi:hypothetical protein